MTGGSGPAEAMNHDTAGLYRVVLSLPADIPDQSHSVMT